MRQSICVMDKYGTVTFSQSCMMSSVRVHIKLAHFKPYATHAIHIHEFGDMTEGCKTLGLHYNPAETTHGSMKFPHKPRHAGDLINNFTTDKTGSVEIIYMDEMLTMFGDNSIVGRSVVIHDGIDDLGCGGNKESLISGNAGARISCGVIGWKSVK